MPYRRIEELPELVRNVLPENAQHIYLEAYNHAWEEYQNPKERRGPETREEAAHKVAWAAVEKKYRKNEKASRWEKIE